MSKKQSGTYVVPATVLLIYSYHDFKNDICHSLILFQYLEILKKIENSNYFNKTKPVWYPKGTFVKKAKYFIKSGCSF